MPIITKVLNLDINGTACIMGGHMMFGTKGTIRIYPGMRINVNCYFL